jgi:hypothetical protein
MDSVVGIDEPVEVSATESGKPSEYFELKPGNAFGCRGRGGKGGLKKDDANDEGGGGWI